jgi:hypothetical protein
MLNLVQSGLVTLSLVGIGYMVLAFANNQKAISNILFILGLLLFTYGTTFHKAIEVSIEERRIILLSVGVTTLVLLMCVIADRKNLTFIKTTYLAFLLSGLAIYFTFYMTQPMADFPKSAYSLSEARVYTEEKTQLLMGVLLMLVILMSFYKYDDHKLELRHIIISTFLSIIIVSGVFFLLPQPWNIVCSSFVGMCGIYYSVALYKSDSQLKNGIGKNQFVFGFAFLAMITAFNLFQLIKFAYLS